MARYFTHDLETDKLLIRTGGKADWLSLPESTRDAIKRACLWSKSRNCWISRAVAARFWQREFLEQNGFENRGEEGARFSFAERVEAKQERAADRAERMEDRAAAAQSESNRRHAAADAIASFIPMGQPILVGHHSEKRHRRDLERIDNNMRAAVDASSKRDHYQRRAEAAHDTAEASNLSNPAFLGRRIKEGEAEERDLQRRLEGKGMIVSEPPSDEYRERLTSILADVQDKLGFYRHCLETCGRVLWDKAALKGKTHVRIRGRWEEIVKLNPTTVAVPNICFHTVESQRKWALKYAYTEVQDAR